jgi:hypothetical protein
MSANVPWSRIDLGECFIIGYVELSGKRGKRMRKTIVVAACLSSILLAAACFSPQVDLYAQASANLTARLEACTDASMKKSDLVMQVGSPTTKEVVDDGEVWTYQLNEQGSIISQTTYYSGNIIYNPTSTTVTGTSRYSASITVRLNRQGRWYSYAFRGQKGALYGTATDSLV